MNVFFAVLPDAVNSFLDHVQFLNPEQTIEMLAAECYWFFGGMSFAFVLCAFSMIIRATRGASRDVDL